MNEPTIPEKAHQENPAQESERSEKILPMRLFRHITLFLLVIFLFSLVITLLYQNGQVIYERGL